MVIGYYNGTLVYNNLYRDKDVERKYEEGMMSVSVNEFQTYAVRISNAVNDSNREGLRCLDVACTIKSTLLY